MSTRARWHDRLVNLAAHPIGWPLARCARRIGRVLTVPGLGTVINDAEMAHDILTDDVSFTKNGEGSLSATVTEMLGPQALSNMDGAAHAQLRSRLTDLVSPSQAGELLRGCSEPLAAMERALRNGETVDLAQAMRWMSGNITFDMLGIVPPPETARESCLALVTLGERIASGLDFRTPTPAHLARLRHDCDQLVAYARHGYSSADAPPRSFVRRLRDLGFTFDEARGVIGLIFLAGTLTTAAALPRIVALLIDSHQIDALRGNSARVTQAIAEGLRFTSPVPATMRIAQRDTVVRGRRFRAGTRLILLTCNLTRDPAMFDAPDRFDATRLQPARARHMWFGAGPHFCLGFAIAQRQLQQVLERIVALEGQLRIAHRERARGVIVPAYRRLDVMLMPTA
jgi:cytochrome P450